MTHHDDPPGGPPAPTGDGDGARLARDDIYRMVALLWQLDRLHNPILHQAPGDFRIAADPPALLPPTGVPGMPADQAPQVWAPEPTRRPQRPLPPVTVAWVEPAAVVADGQVASPTPPLPAVPQPPALPPPPPPARAGPATAHPTTSRTGQAMSAASPAPNESSQRRVPPSPAAGLPDTPPPSQTGRTGTRGGDPGDSPDSVVASGQPALPDNSPLQPQGGPPAASPPIGPGVAAAEPPADLPTAPTAPGSAPGAPSPAPGAAAVPPPADRSGPHMAPAANGPPPTTEPPGMSQLAAHRPGLAAAQVAGGTPIGTPSIAQAESSWPQTVVEPVTIVPTGQFSPSPAPVVAESPAPGATPDSDDSDRDDDWDLDPLPDPGRHREVTVLRRGREAGSLTRAQAARLEEELRRRFRDRSPGGSL